MLRVIALRHRDIVEDAIVDRDAVSLIAGAVAKLLQRPEVMHFQLALIVVALSGRR